MTPTAVLEKSAANDDVDAMATPFMKCLVRLMRAQDTYDAWEGRSDASILTDFIVTKEQRREIPIIGDPDPDVLWRLEIFYSAVGLAIEQETGIMASPMMKMSHEGFGRVLLTTGRLVVVLKTLRDVHRFGFENLSKLAEAGNKLVQDAAEMVGKFPDVAKY
ncbi:MAG: NifX-associated nitrogen fixation protein [Alphaproteobacteria bacterium]|nr:NifX-associated nitrogen fixation protein [Rhizobiaceae bacterium]MBU3963272.1 NifX-associated nitrogen fixation protein [Alphaproteobacteria bacterium]MBU4048874.1 NifX-associated nitrogen fixation protein [Alphaproteobacteria bacterium]MBU4090295.1 NifX-associated nitrogen fixation protein [Alphaproteobacteria bacterium]MBU4158773.1 NifX-associated nitrogen fixation protein [Alphaproteobacteria bacterium]